MAYDVFHAMDRRRADAVRRIDFLWALGALGPGLHFQRIIRKAGLSPYFYSTSQDLFLEDFLRRVFPCLTPSDHTCMWRWVSFRKAWHVLQEPEFRASRDDLQGLFTLLSVTGEARFPVSALQRACILTEMEVQSAMQGFQQDSSLSFADFLMYFQPVLSEKYAHSSLSNNDATDFCTMARDRLQQTLAPAKSAWDEGEDPTPSFIEAPPSHRRAPPHGLPRLPRRARGCAGSGGHAAIAGCRAQRAPAPRGSSRAVRCW